MSLLRIEHRRFMIWSAASLFVALPLWWLWGADLALAALKPAAALIFRLFGLSGQIDNTVEGWRIGTHLPLANGEGLFAFDIARGNLRRQLLGFPLLLAFLIAPPRTGRPLRATLIGVLALSLVFLLGVTAYIWGEIAPILNPALAPPDAPREAILAAQPLHPAVAQLVLLGRYASMSIMPLLSAILIWAAVNPAGAAAMAPRQEA